MEPVTVNVFFISSQLFIAILFLIYVLSTRKMNGFFYSYIAGKLLQAGGVTLFILESRISDYWSQNIGAALLFVGYGLVIYNIISFEQVFKRKTAVDLAAGTLILVLASLLVGDQPYFIKATTLCAGGIFYYSYGGISLMSRKDKTPFQVAIGVNYLVFMSAWIAWGYFLLSGGNAYVPYSSNFGFDFLRLAALANILISSVGYLLILNEQDAIKIRRQREVIEQDNVRLKELDAKKNKFFSIISHDLMNPIGNLTQLGYLLITQNKNIQPTERDKLVNAIYESSKRSHDLLINLLEWARSESNVLTVNAQEVNLTDIISRNLGLYQENIASKQLQVVNQVNSPVHCFADFNMIDTVVRNLLSNAVKFTPLGGAIRLSHTSDNANGSVSVLIEDSGIGMNEETARKLFDIDSNISTRGTNGEKGTGLGLKLCQEFVRKNHGEIRVRSKVGQGTTFEVVLPAVDRYRQPQPG